MFCTECGSDVPDGAIACPSCGTRLTTQGPARATQPASPAGTAGPAASHAGQVTGPAFRFDPNRWTTGDRITGISTVLLLISLFLPWYGVSVLGASFTVSGTSAHWYLVIGLLLAQLLIGYLVLQSGWDKPPLDLPIAHAPLLLIGTGLQLLLVFIGFLDKPAGLSWEIGAYLALVAAVAAAAPVVVPAVRSWQDSR